MPHVMLPHQSQGEDLTMAEARKPAVGMIETRGLLTAYEAADAMMKAAPVDLVATLGIQPRYYISIQDTDDDPCLFLWGSSPVGDAVSWSLDEDLGSNPDLDIMAEDFGSRDGDRSVCINPSP